MLILRSQTFGYNLQVLKVAQVLLILMRTGGDGGYYSSLMARQFEMPREYVPSDEQELTRTCTQYELQEITATTD